MFPISLIYIYNRALSELEQHWRAQRKTLPYCEDPYQDSSFSPPWFGDLESWLEQVIRSADGKIGGSIDAHAIYPSSILKYRHQLAVELGYLLPKDGPTATAILPVLLTGYISNRRGDPKGEEREAGPRYSANLFFSLLRGGDSKQLSYFLHNGRKLFRPRHWSRIFPQLSIKLDLATLKKSLSGYGLTRIFLFLLYKMRDLCNLTASLQLFDELTGYVSILSPCYPHCEGQLDGLSDPLREEVIDFLETMLIDVLPSEIEDHDNLHPNNESNAATSDPLLFPSGPFSFYEFIAHFMEELIARQGKSGKVLTEEKLEQQNRRMWKFLKEMNFMINSQYDDAPLSDQLDIDLIEFDQE